MLIFAWGRPYTNTNLDTLFTAYSVFLVCEEFQDTKGVIRFHKSKQERQHNGQKKKYKRTNNDLQSIHIKLKIELHES